MLHVALIQSLLPAIQHQDLEICRICKASRLYMCRQLQDAFLLSCTATCCTALQAIQAVGWHNQPFQLIVIDRQSTHPAIRSDGDFFIHILDKLSGTETLSLAHLPDAFCANEALIGAGTNGMLIAHDFGNFGEPQTDAEVAHARGAFSGLATGRAVQYGRPVNA